VHRRTIVSTPARDAVTQAGALTVDALDQLADALAGGLNAIPAAGDEALHAALAVQERDDTARLVLGQLAQVLTQRDRLATLANTLHER